jgi:hypothetical protein
MKRLKAARQPNTFYTPLRSRNRAHPVEGHDLFGVWLDATLGDNVSQQHAARYPEDAFFWVQFHPVSPQEIERDVQIFDQVVRLPGFCDYVVYVRLNSLPHVVFENVLHTSLVRSAGVSEAKWHRYVAKHAEWCDEGGCELNELLHLYLVVPVIGIKETQEFAPRSKIYDLIDPWQRKMNFGTWFIQSGVIYTHPLLPILFLNYYRIG